MKTTTPGLRAGTQEEGPRKKIYTGKRFQGGTSEGRVPAASEGVEQ